MSRTPTEPAASGPGPGPWRSLARLAGIDLRDGEGTTAALLFLSFLLLFAFQYATKSLRQATFVDSLGAARLPWVYLLVAVASYPMLRFYGRIAGRVAYRRVIVGTFLTVAVTLLAFWGAFARPTAAASVVFYLWTSVVFGLTVSQLWFLASRFFDARQARRLYGFIGAGALLGSVAGGQIARLVTGALGTRAVLLAGAALIATAAVLVLRLHRDQPQHEGAERLTVAAALPESGSGLGLFRRSRHLRGIGVMLVLGMVVGQIVDLQFNWAVEQATTALDERTAYFGNLFSIIGLAAFAFQLLLTTRIHRTLGVASALRVLPATLALGSASLLLAGALAPAALLRLALGLKVAETGLRYSLDQASRELLFLPLPAALRIRAKAFIDVFVQRAGKGLAALLLLPVTFGLLTPVEAGWAALAAAVAWLWLTRPVHREYLRSFRSSLQQRRVDPALPIQISDTTTLELLIQSLGSPDPRQVLNSLEVLAAHGRGNLVLPLLLHHDDAEVRRRTLEILGEVGRRDAVPLIERRLRDSEPEIRALAIRVLAQLSDRDACELMLPRLEEGHASVRAAAVAYLLHHGSGAQIDAASEVLGDLLRDADPEVRAEAAKALSTVPDPAFREQLLKLLYDPDPGVARQAILGVERRLSEPGSVPLYLPTLVALLRNRRLKHDARRTLVAHGERAIAALVHFLRDEEEDVWVRRALPKALAAIGTADAAKALAESLPHTRDAHLRRKVVEALCSMEGRMPAAGADELLAECRRELGGWLAALRDLVPLGAEDRFRLAGPRLEWTDPERDPGLLEQLLIEALEDRLKNAFGLLALTHDPDHVWPAYRGVLSRKRTVRSHALELLDNVLHSEIRRDLFLVADELPAADKLAAAREALGLEPADKVEILERLLNEGDAGDERAAHLAAAAAYTVYADRVAPLFERVGESAENAGSRFVRETADWAARRLAAAGTPSGATA